MYCRTVQESVYTAPQYCVYKSSWLDHSRMLKMYNSITEWNGMVKNSLHNRSNDQNNDSERSGNDSELPG